MDFDSYQKFTLSTAIYPGAGTGSPEAVVYCALGIAGEAGEIHEKLKRLVRGSSSRPGGFQALATLSEEDRLALAKEAGDVFWYLSRLIDELGLSLSEVIASNVEKLSSRRDRGVLRGTGDDR